MRSAMMLGLVALAACKPATQAPAEPSDTTAASEVTVDPRGSPTDQPPPPPTLPGDLTKTPVSISTPNPLKGKHYQALGTEPFWSFEVLPGKLIYTSPDVQPGIAVLYTYSSSGKQMRYAGTLLGKPLLLTIEPGTCSDGMSDTVYPYKAMFVLGDQSEQGCARAK